MSHGDIDLTPSKSKDSDSSLSSKSYESPPALTSSSSVSTVEMTPAVRKRLALEFMRDRFDMDFDELNEDQKVRLQRIMSPDFTWSPTKSKTRNSKFAPNTNAMVETTFRVEFEAFCDRPGMEKWKDLTHFFFDEEALDSYLVIRHQRSGTCYKHGTIVFVHYLTILRSDDENADHKMLDMSTYMREHMADRELLQYIIDPIVGGPLQFLADISGLEKFEYQPSSLTQLLAPHDRDTHEREARRMLDILKCEPLLVIGFMVENDFIPKIQSKEDEDNELPEQKVKYTGRIDLNDLHLHTFLDGEKRQVDHTMVMLGGYEDVETGKISFLLQNWWEGKFFVEVDAEYLASSCCQVVRVLEGVKVSLKDTLETTDAMHAEAFAPMESCLPTNGYNL